MTSLFFHVDHLNARIKLLPLWSDQFEVDTVKLHGARINLSRNSEGVTNWSDLVQAEADTRAQRDSTSLPLAAVVFGGVDIQDASFSWDDQTTEEQYVISDFNMNTGELVYGEPVQLTLRFNANSTKPQLSSTTALSSTITYDLDNERYDISPLQFDSTITGANVPGGEATIHLESTITIDLENETLAITVLEFDALETQISGIINATNIRSTTPSLKVEMNVTGEDLATWVRVAEIEPLATQIENQPDRRFELVALVDADMQRGDVTLSGLDARLLGASFKGDIKGRNIQSTAPSYNASLEMQGNDLSILLKLAGIEPLASQIAELSDRQFDIVTSLDADMSSGDVDISRLNAKLLGATIQGNVSARNIQSSTPEFKGSLNAAGPDLPMLMQVIGQFQGSDSSLSKYGKQLSRVPSKAFTINTDFDSNLKSGNIDLPSLAIDAFGIKLQSNLTAKEMQKSNGSVSGKLTVSASRLKEVLIALEQKTFAEVLQSVNFNAVISGTRSNLVLNPMDLKLTFSGKQIPNSPVDLLISANTIVNLDSESLALNNLALSGQFGVVRFGPERQGRREREQSAELSGIQWPAGSRPL